MLYHRLILRPSHSPEIERTFSECIVCVLTLGSISLPSVTCNDISLLCCHLLCSIQLLGFISHLALYLPHESFALISHSTFLTTNGRHPEQALFQELQVSPPVERQADMRTDINSYVVVL